MKRILLWLLLSAALIVSCNRDGEIFYEETAVEASLPETTRALQSGSDPFAIDVMQRAMDIVAANNPSIQRVTLRPTGYYVKFNPQDSVQMETLEGLGITLFNHPLDNKVYPETEPENVTVDSPLIYEPLYAVVPADFTFPQGVDYEIIHGVFIQRSGRASASEVHQLPMELYGSVLDASLQLTGNASSTRAAVQEFEASARLRYTTSGGFYNISPDTLPLVGAKVLAFYYTDVSWRTTDANGETGTICITDTPVRYEVHWGGDLWDIYIASKNQKRITILEGTHSGPVDTVFATGTWEGVLAGMNTALYSYFKKDYPLTHGLKKPAKRIKIAAMNKYGRSSAVPIRPSREIFFYGKKYKNSTTYHQTEEAMNTMFHELGHISHNRLNDFNYSFVARSPYGESWATGVEYAYMKSLFPEYENTYYSNKGDRWMYKHVMQCMFRNGFTMQEIQHGFNAAASSGWDGWHRAMKENVIDKWTDRSEEYKARMRRIIDIVFAYPNTATFDMRDIVDAERETACVNQVVRFRLNDEARAATKPSVPPISEWSWEVADSDGVVVPADFVHKPLFVYFTQPGTKTIRLKAKVFGEEMIYEKQVRVATADILLPPEDPVVGLPAAFTLHPKMAELGIEVSEWAAGAGDTCTTYLPALSSKVKGTFRFSQSGERTVKATVMYPLLQDTVSYEMKTRVREPDSDELFYVMNRPQSFQYNTAYRAVFNGVDEEIESIEKIEFNHYSYLFYHDFTSWSFDANSWILTFSIPKFDVSMDYILTIYYKVKGSPEVKEAILFVSNYR